MYMGLCRRASVLATVATGVVVCAATTSALFGVGNFDDFLGDRMYMGNAIFSRTKQPHFKIEVKLPKMQHCFIWHHYNP